jgi:hypothetical protein
MRFSRLILLTLMLGMITLAAASCSTPNADSTHLAMVAKYVGNAAPSVRAAYEYAVKHPQELAKYPCYCGCNAIGHTSNLSCFVKRFDVNNAPIFDSHGLGCGICVDIALDVMRLKGEGRPSREVRAYIDARYGGFGASTDTPWPLD